MLLFDDSKKLEKVIGEEAATVITHMFEKLNEENKRELATKGDLRESEARIKADIIKWVAGMLVAQAALIATLVKLL